MLVWKCVQSRRRKRRGMWQNESRKKPSAFLNWSVKENPKGFHAIECLVKQKPHLNGCVRLILFAVWLLVVVVFPLCCFPLDVRWNRMRALSFCTSTEWKRRRETDKHWKTIFVSVFAWQCDKHRPPDSIFRFIVCMKFFVMHVLRAPFCGHILWCPHTTHNFQEQLQGYNIELDSFSSLDMHAYYPYSTHRMVSGAAQSQRIHVFGVHLLIIHNIPIENCTWSSLAKDSEQYVRRHSLGPGVDKPWLGEG